MQSGNGSKRSIDLHFPPFKRILDVGCGTGWVVSEAQREGNPVCVGVDYCFEPLRDGKRSDHCVRFVQGDAMALPFADNTFDCVVGHVSMPYMRTREGLDEIYRVLVPGGSVFLTFHSLTYVTRRMRSSIRRREWKDVPFMFYVAGNALLNRLGLGQIRFFWGSRSRFETANTPGAVAATARATGFRHVSVEFAPERIFFAVTARKPDAVTRSVQAAPAWAVYSSLVSGADENTPERVQAAYV